MQKADSPQGKQRNVAFFLTGLLILAADQLSKIWIRSNLAEGESLPETGLFQLSYVHNTGAVFGLFRGHSFALAIASLIGIVVLLFLAPLICRRYPLLDTRLSKTALGLVLGGTAGNLVDRLRFGYVTDFIDIGFWPAFNVADSATVAGVIIFAYFLLRSTRVKK